MEFVFIREGNFLLRFLKQRLFPKSPESELLASLLEMKLSDKLGVLDRTGERGGNSRRSPAQEGDEQTLSAGASLPLMRTCESAQGDISAQISEGGRHLRYPGSSGKTLITRVIRDRNTIYESYGIEVASETSSREKTENSQVWPAPGL